MRKSDESDFASQASERAAEPPVAGWAHEMHRAVQWLDARGSPRTGIGLMLVSCGLLVCGDAIAKWLTVTYPVGQVICLRGLIILALLTALHGSAALTHFRPRHATGQIWRALFFVASTFLMVWSFKLLPLPTVSAISFTAPLLMTALAPLVLGEWVGWRRWCAVTVGFVGVLIIIDPREGRWDAVMLLPIAAALFAALRDLTTRKIAGFESATSMVFIAVGATVLAGASTAAFGWVMPAAFDLLLFMLLGLVHGIAYLLQVAAFRAAEAGLLAPFKYSLLLWAIAIGFVVWGHLPTASMLLGTAIVIGSGVYAWSRELKAREVQT